MNRIADHTESETNRLALVVDDDPVLRLAVKQFIERLGFQTLDAGDGRRAVELFTEHRPDIVLMDAAMPELDGFAACEAIRDLPDGAFVPVIMITVYEDEASVDRAFRAGANEYITKPIHWAVLRNRVLHLVSSYHAEQRLRDDHAFFQCLVDAIPDPTVVVDRDLKVRWINDSVTDFFLLEQVSIGDPLVIHETSSIADDESASSEQRPIDFLMRSVLDRETLECLLSCGEDDDGRRFAQLSLRVLRGVKGDSHGFILRLQDVTTRERERLALRQEASTQGDLARRDTLTGLANRRHFKERMGALVGAGRQGKAVRLALLFLDLDGFKAINDTHGHAAGDLLLCTIAGRLEQLVRSSDLVARLGGDEFAILLTDLVDTDAALRLAERLLDSICQPVMINGIACTVSASIGIGIYPDHADHCEALVTVADDAMYQVKQSGKNGALLANTAP